MNVSWNDEIEPRKRYVLSGAVESFPKGQNTPDSRKER